MSIQPSFWTGIRTVLARTSAPRRRGKERRDFSPRLAGRNDASGRAGRGVVMRGEMLEARSMLTVSASLVGTDLTIALGAADDVVTVTTGGGNYTVVGTGFASTPFAVASVASVSVAGNAGANQQFFLAGATSFDASLGVDPSVESSALSAPVGTVVASPAVSIGSAAIALPASVTTSGAQTYAGAVTLSADTTLAGTTITNGSTISGGGNALTVITVNAVVNGGISGVTNYAVSGTTSLGANVTTSGTQTYSGAVTLITGATLTGTIPSFGAGVAGGGHNLTLNFSGTTPIDGAFTGIRDLSSSGVTTLSGIVATSGTQTYSGAVTLLAGTTLAGTTVTNGSTLSGGGNALTVSGNAVISGAVSGVTNYSVVGTTSLGASVTTAGSQFYSGVVTLTADATLAGTTPTFGGGVAGGGHDLALNFSGRTVVDGTFAGIRDLASGGGGETMLSGVITTTGTQTYSDAVMLLDATTLVGTTPTFGGGVVGSGHDLVLTFSGTTAIDGTFADIKNLSSGGSGTTTLSGAITTTGAQTYSGAVILLSDTTLNGTAPTFGGGVSGGGHDLALTFSGPTAIDATFTGIRNLSSNGGGVTTLSGVIATTGTQIYSDAVTLLAEATLVATTVTNGDTLSGGGNALTITGDTVVNGAISGVSNYVVVGTASLGANVTTGGVQFYAGAVTLTADATLVGISPSFGSSVTGGGHDLTLTFSGLTAINGAFTGIRNLSSNGGGTTTLAGAITTTGSQAYADTVTLLADTTLSGTDPTFGGGVAGSGRDLALNFSGTTAIDGSFTTIRNLSSGGGGQTTLSGLITTSGAQSFADTVTLAADASLASQGVPGIDFLSEVDGGHNLVLTAVGGHANFARGVGSVSPLASLRLESADSVTASGALFLDGSLPGASVHGLVIVSGVNNITMRTSGSTISNYSGYGVVLSPTQGTTLSGFILSNNVTGGLYATGVQTGTSVSGNILTNNPIGMFLYEAQGFAASGNLIQDSTLFGVYASGNSSGSSLTGNVLSGASGYGILLSDATGISVGGVGVAGNTISGAANGLLASGTLSATSVLGNTIRDAVTGLYLSNAQSLSVSGNQIQNSSITGIYATGAGAATTLTGNLVNGAASSGIFLSNVTGMVVGGAGLDGNTVSNAANGLIATGTLTGTSLVGNTIQNGATGLYLLAAQGLLATGNRINNNATGLYATGVLSDTSLDGNTFSSNASAVVLLDAKALAFGTTVGNQIQGSSSTGLYAAGDSAGTVVKNNTILGGAYGIVLSGAKNLVVRPANKVVSNTVFGLYATGDSTGTIVQENQISGNGINIETSTATGGSFQSV